MSIPNAFGHQTSPAHG